MNRWGTLQSLLGNNSWAFCDTEQFDLIVDATNADSIDEAFRMIDVYCRTRQTSEIQRMNMGRLLRHYRQEGGLISMYLGFPALSFNKTIYKVVRNNPERCARNYLFDVFCDEDGEVYYDLDTMASALHNQSYDYKDGYADAFRSLGRDVSRINDFIKFGEKSGEAIQGYFVRATNSVKSRIEIANDLLDKDEAERYGHYKVDELGFRQTSLDLFFRLTENINFN